MSGLRTSKDSSSVISLPESPVGQKPCAVPESPQLDLFGQALAPVKTSVVPASRKVSRASATSGPPSTISSASAALNSSLASRLKTLCATVGSTVYTQTWKERVTPAGLSYWEHIPRGRTTSDKGYTGWLTPRSAEAEHSGRQANTGHTGQTGLAEAASLTGCPTPNTPSGGPNVTSTPNHAGGMDLEGAASLVGWKTPHASDGEGGVMEMRPDCDGHYKLRDQAALTGWPTPRQEDSEQTGAHNGKPDTLHSATQLAGWARPASRDYKDTPGMSQTGANPDGSERSRLDQLPRQASLAISGPTQSPTSAKTESTGVLNPAFSRWLQSFPEAWCQAAILAYRAMQTQRRKPASCV